MSYNYENINLNKIEKKWIDDHIKMFFLNGVIYINNFDYEETKNIINGLITKNVIYNKKINFDISEYEINKFPRRNDRSEISLKDHLFYFNNDYLCFLGKQKLLNKRIKSGHDQIIYSLIDFLRKKEDNLYISNFGISTKYGTSRPDLYILNNTSSLSNVAPLCFEIKHSRSDFLSDIKKLEKRASYLEISESLYYVCPESVISPDEIPPECGLIYMSKNGEFYNVVEAPKHNHWKNNFSYELLLTLIKSQDYSDKRIIVNEKENTLIKCQESDFFKELIVPDNIMLSNRQLDVVMRSRFVSNGKIREYHLFEDEYNVFLELFGLGLFSFQDRFIEYENKSIYDEYFIGNSIFKKEKLKLLNETIANIKSPFRDHYRKSSDKFNYDSININGRNIFNFYSFNKTNKIEKAGLSGYINIKNKDELLTTLKNEDYIQKCVEHCQKLSFYTPLNSDVKKKDIPKEFGLYDNNGYVNNDFPLHEIKRAKKRNIQDVNKQILWELFKKEYYGNICISLY